ncbi:MAG: HEAT repeat domain-containing protein [Polyangiaceae bacterium]|nr:HEAT repeat domain-containing protein [Polyangiaceae bacterium]
MAARKPKPTVEALVAALAELPADAPDPEAAGLVRAALGHRHWMAVEHAARAIARHGWRGFEADLQAVWGRFVDPGPKLDPGCRAKAAALTALDVLELFDPDPFLQAIRYVQFEPSWGGREDSAGGVRQRALFGLLRQRHSDALLYAGELLADPSIDVRAGAAEAIGQYGETGGACLLVHRLRAGDDPRVLLACASSLIALADGFARSLLGEWLRAGTEAQREIAALALGQSRAIEDAETLIRWLDGLAGEVALELGIRALSLHRSERARSHLLELIATGSLARARAAVRALGEHRYDVALTARVREAARLRKDMRLRKVVEEVFG